MLLLIKSFGLKEAIVYSQSGKSNCQRCFYLSYNHKIRPPSLPFTLNSAVDNLCKNEFDHYRAKAEPHPMFIEHGIDAVPFAHEKMGYGSSHDFGK